MKKIQPNYDGMRYNRCGKSGLKLPAISLGLWHNFGGVDSFEISQQMIIRAFELGITHFDLANNYGPPPGTAEITFGKILKQNLIQHRDELIISTKAGYYMWPGPYGDWGSRKYLLASLDQSLKRMNLDYVDIFYHHRPDPKTPMEETMAALDHAVRKGKALYAGISNYNSEQTQKAAKILSSLGTPCLIHQPNYNMFDRWIEDKLLDTLVELRIGCIVFSPLAQGILSGKYLQGIPKGSRASKNYSFLQPDQIENEKIAKVENLIQIAKNRNQSLPQMAIAWILRHPAMTSVLVGTSTVIQIEDNVGALNNLRFAEEELQAIEEILD